MFINQSFVQTDFNDNFSNNNKEHILFRHIKIKLDNIKVTITRT